MNIGLNIVLSIIFLYLLYVNIQQDISDTKELDGILCHKEIELPKIKIIDKLMIESVIENYGKNKSRNKSNSAKIWTEIKSGFTRGALGGAIVSSDLGVIFSGALVFGSMSGLFKAYNLIYGSTLVLRYKKHT
jgi:hypothetical protein